MDEVFKFFMSETKLSAYVDKVLYQKAKLLAKKQRRSVSAFIALLIEAEVERWEKETGESLGTDNEKQPP